MFSHFPGLKQLCTAILKKKDSHLSNGVTSPKLLVVDKMSCARTSLFLHRNSETAFVVQKNEN